MAPVLGTGITSVRIRPGRPNRKRLTRSDSVLLCIIDIKEQADEQHHSRYYPHSRWDLVRYPGSLGYGILDQRSIAVRRFVGQHRGRRGVGLWGVDAETG